MRDEHFTNISVEIWVQSSNMYGFLGLLSNLRGFFVNDGKDWGQGVVVVSTVFVDCWCSGFGVCFGSLPEGSWSFSHVRWFASISFTVHLWSSQGVKPISLYISTLFRSFFISPDEGLSLEVETSWVTSLQVSLLMIRVT